MVASTAKDAVEQINMETEYKAHIGQGPNHFLVEIDGNVDGGMSLVGGIAHKHGFKLTGIVYESVYFHKI